jgi:hypothetical protein
MILASAFLALGRLWPAAREGAQKNLPSWLHRASDRSAEKRLVSVQNLQYWETSNSLRVIVDLSGSAEFRQGSASAPERVFVDIMNAKADAALLKQRWPISSDLLRQIRVGQFDNKTVRIVFDLGMIAGVTSYALNNPDRLIVDILGEQDEDLASVPTSTIR